MYNEDYFYGLSDLMHHNVYASLLKDKIIKEERCIIKIFKKDNEVVVIETCNMKDTILKDTRKDKNSDLMEFDLIFLKTLERYYADYEAKGMIYEYMDGLGAWYRVKLDGLKPNDEELKSIYLKKLDDNKKIQKYLKLTKGLIKFSKPNKVQKFFENIEK